MPITAQKAQERYNQGTVSSNMPKMFPTLQQRLANMKNIKATTVQGKPGLFSNAASISQITGQQPNGRPDTVYVETPKHMPFMNVQPRMAGKAPSNPFMDYSDAEAQDYNVLGRRFNQAKSVSVKEQGGTMQQNEATRRLLAAAIAFCVSQQIQPNEESITKVMPQMQQMMRQQPQQFEELANAGEQMLQQAEQQQASAQPKTAKLGAKLDYLNKLKGICPEGTEKVYLQKGGCMCKQKAAEGAELKKKERPKNEIQKFKAAKGCKTSKRKKN